MRFKVGDMIVGNKHNKYGITNKFSICKVIQVLPKEEDYEDGIIVEVVDYVSRSKRERFKDEIGSQYDVQSRYFDLYVWAIDNEACLQVLHRDELAVMP